MKYVLRPAMTFVLALIAGTASAYPSWQAGRITNVTFAGDDVYIMMDSGVPDNCVGTPYNWMVIPASAKSTKAFVIGLWLRGDIGQIQMTVYTSGRDSGGAGYCQVNQLDPVE